MAVRTVIQHRPGRPTLERTIASCNGLYPDVVLDPDPLGKPSAWRTYRRCLEGPHGTSHLLILQDDVVCQPGLATAAVVAAGAEPDALIAFFHSPYPRRARTAMYAALRTQQPFFRIPAGYWVQTVALMWPVRHIEPFLHWIDAVKKPRPDFLGDDPLVGAWASRARITALGTAPCLVEHPDDTDSLFGRKATQRRKAIVLGDCEEWMSLLTPAATAATVAHSESAPTR